jgi:hypothetical protein
MLKKLYLLVIIFFISSIVLAHHDEPGSYREFELKRERVEIELNITELLHQMTYMPVDARPILYQEMQDLQKRWNEIIQELIQIDQAEHPYPTRP